MLLSGSWCSEVQVDVELSNQKYLLTVYCGMLIRNELNRAVPTLEFIILCGAIWVHVTPDRFQCVCVCF
jgi:hypothetical protein